MSCTEEVGLEGANEKIIESERRSPQGRAMSLREGQLIRSRNWR
jgi:hypothetical protein